MIVPIAILTNHKCYFIFHKVFTLVKLETLSLWTSHANTHVQVRSNHGDCMITVQVKVDLKALASECIPELNLEEELQKQLLPSPPPSPAREKSVKLN